ncbi:MAG TPA: heavy-metal-associated domain-containing protein [Chitinophagaceae bacterium]
MKLFRFLLLAFAVGFSLNTMAQDVKTDSIRVYGNCGMCESRIVKALKTEGVEKVTWDSETQMLVVTYDAARITNDEIQKKVAAVGHDTEKYKADDKVYGKLPGCCQYERKKAEQ